MIIRPGITAFGLDPVSLVIASLCGLCRVASEITVKVFFGDQDRAPRRVSAGAVIDGADD